MIELDYNKTYQNMNALHNSIHNMAIDVYVQRIAKALEDEHNDNKIVAAILKARDEWHESVRENSARRLAFLERFANEFKAWEWGL